MKRLMIIGASVLQLPAIKKAKEMGLEIAVADYNPSAIGISFADHFYNASTIDIEAITKAAMDYKPDGIMTLATDMPMRSIAVATTALDLPGISFETAVRATDKIEMIAAFKAFDVPSPWYFSIISKSELEEIKDNLTYPCLIKPADNSGSRGVDIITSKEYLNQAYEYSVSQSRNGHVLIEEYLQGEEVSVEVMVTHGKVHVIQVTDKLTTGAPHFVEMGHSQPSHHSANVIYHIHKVAEQAVKAIGLTDGPAHVEIMVTQDGPKMIELGARLGGDCITTHLVPLSTGVDMVKATIEVSLGIEPNLSSKYTRGSAIRYFDVKPGTITQILGLDKAQAIDGVKEVILTKSVGEKVESIKSSLDRVGMVIAQGKNAQEAIEICEHAIKEIIIETK